MLILINGSTSLSFKMDGAAMSVQMNEVHAHRSSITHTDSSARRLWPLPEWLPSFPLVSVGQLAEGEGF